jgi:hypothetical protein
LRARVPMSCRKNARESPGLPEHRAVLAAVNTASRRLSAVAFDQCCLAPAEAGDRHCAGAGVYRPRLTKASRSPRCRPGRRNGTQPNKETDANPDEALGLAVGLRRPRPFIRTDQPSPRRRTLVVRRKAHDRERAGDAKRRPGEGECLSARPELAATSSPSPGRLRRPPSPSRGEGTPVPVADIFAPHAMEEEEGRLALHSPRRAVVQPSYPPCLQRAYSPLIPLPRDNGTRDRLVLWERKRCRRNPEGHG